MNIFWHYDYEKCHLFQDFVGRLSSEKQPDNADAENAELERGLISDVSEVEADRIAVTITTEGSPYLGETATCSRLGFRLKG